MRNQEVKSGSIQAVAKAAGVSAMTVSRAMRGIEGVSEATRKRILEIADELNYVPNNNARALAATNSSLIGMSVPTLYNDVFADILSGLRETLERSGYSSVIGVSNYSEIDEVAWVKQVLRWRPAAFVLTGTHHNEQVQSLLQSAQVPTMEVWGWSETPIDMCVGIDHEQAGRTLAEYALELGYQKPAFIGTPPGVDKRADMRFDGIAAAFSEQGFGAPHRIFVDGTRNFGDGQRGFSEVRLNRTDVVFFLNDHYAFGGLMAAERMGVLVPQNLGIIGFNDLDLNTVITRQLTTLRTPRRRIGTEAAKNILARLNGVDAPVSVCLQCGLIEGATTRKQLP